MPRVVPSQIIALIDERFPIAEKGGEVRPGPEYAPTLACIVKMAREIPDELLQISGSDYSNFMLGIEGLDHTVKS